MDRWQKERDRDVEKKEEAMTGGTKTAVFLMRLSVSWEAKRTSQTHTFYHRASLLVTSTLRDKNAKCHNTSIASTYWLFRSNVALEDVLKVYF